MRTTRPPLKSFRRALIFVVAGFVWLLSVRPAQANYIVTLEQVGSDVIATGSGTIDITGLIQFATDDEPSFMSPNSGEILTGTSDAPSALYTVNYSSRPTSFGNGNFKFANSGTGDFVGVAGTDVLNVPAGYLSDTALSDSSTYNNATFSSLGVTPGTYVWIWGTGPDQRLTLEIGVPESGSSFVLLFLALMPLFGAARFRYRAVS